MDILWNTQNDMDDDIQDFKDGSTNIVDDICNECKILI